MTQQQAHHTMAAFDILQHVDKLQPDGGKSNDNGDSSYICPACGADNFKVNLKTGKWTAFGCECGNSEAGKRRIRDALSPALPVGSGTVPATFAKVLAASRTEKEVRPVARREWIYQDSSGTPVLQVCRTDDGKGGRKIWQQSLVDGKRPAELAAAVLPYRLRDAQQAIAEGRATQVFWVEGEPAADALWAIGLPATTSIGGAGKFKAERDGGHLAGEQLVIAPDRDQPGIRHGHDVAAAYPGSRWLLAFPGTPEWNGSCPPSGGLDVADWIDQGATAEEILASITTVPPSLPEAEPTGAAEGEAQGKKARTDFISDAKTLTDLLKEGLRRIDAEEDDDVRPFAHICLARELGLNSAQFNKLVLQLMNVAGSSMTAEELMAGDGLRVQSVIDDILASGLTVLAGDGHAGKSTLAYQLAEAVAKGGRFSNTFQAVKGNVLIIQMDEPAPVVRNKWRIMGIEFPEGSVRVESQWNYHQLHRLRRWIKEHQAKLVIMDSLRTIAGKDVDAKDSDFGLMIYQLDRLAAETGICILVLHHVSKGEKPQRGKAAHNDAFYEMYKEQMYGSTYVYNGCTDAFMYWSFRSEGSDEPRYALKCIRSRSGVPEIDAVHEFDGSIDDSRNYYTGIRGRTQTYDDALDKYRRVVSYIRSLDGRAATSSEINRALQIGNVRYTSNILRKALSKEQDINRRSLPRLPGTNGRPSYAFWSALGRLDGARGAEGDLEDDHDESGGAGGAAATASEPTADASGRPQRPWRRTGATLRLLGPS